MYKIEFTKSAEKRLLKLNKVSQKRILKALERIRTRPHSYVKKLVGEPYFRMRVGNYRVILDIKAGKFIILVIKLGHRKEIYN